MSGPNPLHRLGEQVVEGLAIQAEGLIDDGTSLKDRFAVTLADLEDLSRFGLVEGMNVFEVQLVRADALARQRRGGFLDNAPR